MFFSCIRIGQLFGWIDGPVKFYGFDQARKTCEENGWFIEDADVAVRIISPTNRLLLILRLFLDSGLVDWIAEVCVKFFRRLDRFRFLRSCTGWFIVLKCLNKKMSAEI